MKNCWYTKSLKDESAKGKIHICGDFGDITYCNKSISSNGRWYISVSDISKVTCKICLISFRNGRLV